MKYQWEKSFKYRVYTYRCPTSWAAMMTPLKLVEASPIPKLKALPRNNGADRQAPLTYATPTVTKMCYFSIRYPSILKLFVCTCIPFQVSWQDVYVLYIYIFWMMSLPAVPLTHSFESLFASIDEMGIPCLIAVNTFGLNGVMVSRCLTFRHAFSLLNERNFILILFFISSYGFFFINYRWWFIFNEK